MVVVSNGHVTFGLQRLLVAEFALPPLYVDGNPLVTSQPHEIESRYILNTDKKPWSLYQMVALLPVWDNPLR
jgi:hypothetical protein